MQTQDTALFQKLYLETDEDLSALQHSNLAAAIASLEKEVSQFQQQTGIATPQEIIPAAVANDPIQFARKKIET